MAAIIDGKKVYYFTCLWRWKEIRERFREGLKDKVGKVSRTDKRDAFMLWQVYQSSLTDNNTHRYFRLSATIDVVLRPLLIRAEMLYKNLQRIRNTIIVGVDV